MRLRVLWNFSLSILISCTVGFRRRLSIKRNSLPKSPLSLLLSVGDLSSGQPGNSKAKAHPYTTDILLLPVFYEWPHSFCAVTFLHIKVFYSELKLYLITSFLQWYLIKKSVLNNSSQATNSSINLCLILVPGVTLQPPRTGHTDMLSAVTAAFLNLLFFLHKNKPHSSCYVH